MLIYQIGKILYDNKKIRIINGKTGDGDLLNLEILYILIIIIKYI